MIIYLGSRFHFQASRFSYSIVFWSTGSTLLHFRYLINFLGYFFRTCFNFYYCWLEIWLQSCFLAIIYRSECGDNCKLKRQQFESELNKIRRDYISAEDGRHVAEQKNRNYEQEVNEIYFFLHFCLFCFFFSFENMKTN